MFTKKCVELDTQSCFANLRPRPHAYPESFKNGAFSPFLKKNIYIDASTPIRIVFEFESLEKQK